MRFRSILLAIIGLMIAFASVVGAQRFVTPKVVVARSDVVEGRTQLVVAKVDIAFGEQIERHMLTTQTWPSDAVPEQAFTSIDQIVGVSEGEYRRAKRALAQGEILLNSKISGFGEKVTIVQTLGQNMRAMAIKVDAVTGVGGFVTPGDRVDVVLTQGQNENLKAVTILQNIRVIGIDQLSDEDASNPAVVRTITVEVTPDQGQKLALAQAAGRLSLTLRTVDGVIDEPMEQVRLDDILLLRSPAEDEKARRPVIIVNRGGERSEVELKYGTKN